jgi:cytochrome P450
MTDDVEGWPIAGNAFDIPSSHVWLKFKEWADEFGPIYQVNAFGTNIVVISKESIANDLFALRGALYSDRPQLIMTGLVSDNGFLGATGWTEYWRRGRRFAQSMLTTANIQQSLPKQTLEARQMVVDLAKDPSKYAYWLERAGVMTSIKQIYGYNVARGPAEEHHVHEITSYMETIDRVAAPGVYLVEFLPWLMHLPTVLAPFKQEAKRLVQRHWNYMTSLVQYQDTPDAPDSFARRYLRSKDDWGLTHREMVWVLSSIYGGASGTSSAAMQSIILNLCLFPQWQQKMQDEIDQAVGDRLPSFEDSGSLPTVRAVIKESMRWRPVLSGGSSQ